MKAEERLKALIKSKGVISVSEYMNFCLYDEQDGYYLTKQPIGKHGDFTTAPEISQIFGEMIAIWLVNLWKKSLAEKDVSLVELGPGRGTLMHDILRVISKFSDVKKHFEVIMVEVSEALKQQQHDKLYPSEIPIIWHDNLNNLPKKPTIIIANEFLDALPAEHAVFNDENWYQRVVKIIDDELQFANGDIIDISNYLHDYKEPEENDIFEYSPNSEAVIKEICNHIKNYGGFALFIDYGYMNPTYGETLQALKKHKYHSVLKNPTEVDLTTHVNFKFLQNLALKKELNAKVISQRNFLQSMGAELRTAELCKNTDQKIQDNLCIATNRLIAKDQMGELFKCLVIAADNVE